MSAHYEKADVAVTRLNMPLVMVASLLVAVCAAWGFEAVSHSKLEQGLQDIVTLKAEQLPNALKFQRIEDKVDHMGDAIERLEQHFGTKK